MVQNLTGELPENVNFIFCHDLVEIKNHKVVSWGGLFGTIMRMVRVSHPDGQQLYRLENHGISFSAAIECCANELEHDAEILGMVIAYYYDIEKINGKTPEDNEHIALEFSKGIAGRNIADWFIETIRNCENWEQLYSELHHTSKFGVDIQNRISEEFKQQCVSLGRLPKTADIKIVGWGGETWSVKIRDRQVLHDEGLLGRIMSIINEPGSHVEILYQFEKEGVIYDAATKYCIQELELNEGILANTIFGSHDIWNIKDEYINLGILVAFSKSAPGRKIAKLFIEKIKNCNSWGELYDEMWSTSEFNNKIGQQIQDGIKEQCRKV